MAGWVGLEGVSLREGMGGDGREGGNGRKGRGREGRGREGVKMVMVM